MRALTASLLFFQQEVFSRWKRGTAVSIFVCACPLGASFSGATHRSEAVAEYPSYARSRTSESAEPCCDADRRDVLELPVRTRDRFGNAECTADSAAGCCPGQALPNAMQQKGRRSQEIDV